MEFRSTDGLITYIRQAFSVKCDSTLGVTSGCFDILHPLHVMYLQKCKAECDILIVLTDSDVLVLDNKSKATVFNQDDRAFMLGSLYCVWASCVMNSLFDLASLLTNSVDRFSKVKLFRNSSTIYSTPCIKVSGVELVVIPDVNIFESTTSLINHIIKNCKTT